MTYLANMNDIFERLKAEQEIKNNGIRSVTPYALMVRSILDDSDPKFCAMIAEMAAQKITEKLGSLDQPQSPVSAVEVALQRRVTMGMWRHYKGTIYFVIGIANETKLESSFFDSCLNLGDFCLTESQSSKITAFQYEGRIFHNGGSGVGDRVLYMGETGRWGRPVEEFLGREKCGSFRFKKVGEDQ